MGSLSVGEIDDRLKSVQENIARAAQRVNRNPAEITLIVVTKSHPIPMVQAVLEAGATDVGENYAQEGVEKLAALGQAFPAARWHMIGHVQSRKAGLVVLHFSLLHSLDRMKLARRLDRFAAQSSKVLPVLLEYNVGGEASKYGWQAWERKAWPGLLPELEEILNFPNLEVRGLMAMAPFSAPGEAARPYFQTLASLRDFFAQAFPAANLSQLSIGMSQDYEVAIEEGATMVRVGQAILGPRPA